MSHTILTVKDLKKTFRLSKKQQKIEKTNLLQKVAVDGLSFSVGEGEIYGLLGPNGAGKTTTLRMIATLISPDEGEITVAGHPLSKNPAAVRASLGFLTGELKLEEYFTPNYLFDFFAALHGIDPAVAAERKARLFTRFGIDRFAEVKVANLSTGMKQKVSLVISIVHDPAIIVFDEPTNGLDVLTARVVTDFLEELKAEGKTILLSTHIFSLVEKLCDRVGILIDGSLAAEGTLAEVCGDRSMEDTFFDIYRNLKGVDAV
ncbi:MAG: ABC transporter ATP-binding protein [Clostridia bacterium]|nr:ABC transporter ATP-binding protein [Clostridia bacterium]